MDIHNIQKIVEKVEGWLTTREGILLYRLARNCPGKGVIVEIGSWKGKSTIWLGHGAKSSNRPRIFAVDPHTGSSEHKKNFGKIWTLEEFKKNIRNAGLNDIVTPVVGVSAKAAKIINSPVELIFIDGAHEYELVKLDFTLWYPKLVTGGIMAFHDTTNIWPGPQRVVAEDLYNSPNFTNVTVVDSITFAQKIR